MFHIPVKPPAARCRRVLVVSNWMLMLLLMALAAGCQKSKYDLVPVTGVVTLDGEPLTDGHVTFQPMMTGENETVGPGSVGSTDEQGRYTLRTIRGDEGAVLGRHLVSIRTDAFREMPAPEGDVDLQPVPKEKVPIWYNDRTILEVDVTADKEDGYDFELSTKPPRR